MTEQAPQREYPLREVFNALWYIARGGCPWQFLPNNFPPFYVAYQQMKRWERGQATNDWLPR
jgi:transposase